ncbi:MAG: Flp pilus assembly protein CpaB [Bryobacteraceae bacterium]
MKFVVNSTWHFMKRNQLVPLLGIAFVVAIVSTGIFYGLFVSKLRSGGATPGGPKVVVAAKSVERGAVIQKSDLKLASWGSPDMPKGAFTSLDKMEGLTALSPLQENEPLLESRVASKDSGMGFAAGVPGGMRAVSVHVSDSSGVISLLRPGHRVDVQLVSNVGLPGELRTILQNAEVLALNGQVEGRGNPVVTLLVKPEEADAVGLGDSSARLRFSLRNPLDKERPPAKRMTLPPLFQGK